MQAADTDMELAAALIRITDSRGNSAKTSPLTSADDALKKGGISNKAAENEKTIEVRFNPTTIKFSNSGAAIGSTDKTVSSIMKKKNADKKQGKGLLESKAYTVSMKLVFDKTDSPDLSVQPEVETFLAMIQNPYLNRIAFYWGTLDFAGILESADAEYVLFDGTGRPLRANVDLKIKVTGK